MPVKDPITAFAEIRTATRARLPGVAIRRRVFFRYTLRWDKPQEPRALLQDEAPQAVGLLWEQILEYGRKRAT